VKFFERAWLKPEDTTLLCAKHEGANRRRLFFSSSLEFGAWDGEHARRAALTGRKQQMGGEVCGLPRDRHPLESREERAAHGSKLHTVQQKRTLSFFVCWSCFSDEKDGKKQKKNKNNFI
jgi:hypothetical protein